MNTDVTSEEEQLERYGETIVGLHLNRENF